MTDWYVYIIETTTGKLYTGISPDPDQRFKKHKEGKGARFFRMHPPKKIVYRELIGSKSDALRRESAIKKMKVSDKHNLIKGG